MSKALEPDGVELLLAERDKFAEWYNECEQRVTQLIEAVKASHLELKKLMQAYVGLLEAGRDRIMDLGGSCDPVDVMENGDPALRRAREFLKQQPPAGEK